MTYEEWLAHKREFDENKVERDKMGRFAKKAIEEGRTGYERAVRYFTGLGKEAAEKLASEKSNTAHPRATTVSISGSINDAYRLASQGNASKPHTKVTIGSKIANAYKQASEQRVSGQPYAKILISDLIKKANRQSSEGRQTAPYAKASDFSYATARFKSGIKKAREWIDYAVGKSPIPRR